MKIDILSHILKYRKNLLRRDFILDIFANCSKYTTEFISPDTISYHRDLYEGQFIKIDNKLYAILSINTDECKVGELEGNLPFNFTDKITIGKNDIENLNETIETTLGRFILNYIVLVYPFGNTIPYINEEWKVGKLEDDLVKLAFKDIVTAKQISTYINSIFYIGHFTELCVPAFSEKSLTTSQAVLDKKKELLEKHKDELDNPVIMANIEAELIALDREYLKDDVSYGYYSQNSKAFNVSRKRMYLAAGMVEELDRPDHYKFISSSLDEGWDKDNLDVLINDVRHGIYGRAMETAKGGEESKFLSRIFRDTKISDENCGSTRGIETILTSDIINKYKYRFIIEDDGSLTMLNEDNMNIYLNKKVTIRSPMYCKSKGCYCYTCTGYVFKKLSAGHLAMLMIDIGSTFLSASMSSMHGKSVKVNDISDINRFVLKT